MFQMRNWKRKFADLVAGASEFPIRGSASGRVLWLCLGILATVSSCWQPQDVTIPQISLSTVWRRALPGTQIVYGVGDRVYSCAGGMVSVLDAATGELLQSQDIGTPAVYAFSVSDLGVFISDDILAPSDRPGFAWFGTDGIYKGRIVLPDVTWVPLRDHRIRGNRLYWITNDGYDLEDPALFHGFVELDLDALTPRNGGDWEGVLRVIWQVPDPKQYTPYDFAFDDSGDFYLSLYNHSKRMDPTLSDGTYAAKIAKFDATTENELWSFQLHDSPLLDNGNAYLRMTPGGLLTWLFGPDRRLLFSADGELKRDIVGGGGISGGALLVGDRLYNAGGDHLSCMNTLTLDYVWQDTKTLLANAGATPGLRDGVVYFIAQEGIYCYEAATGKPIGVDRSYDKGLIMQMSWAETVTWKDLLIMTDGDSVFAVRMDVKL